LQRPDGGGMRILVAKRSAIDDIAGERLRFSDVKASCQRHEDLRLKFVMSETRLPQRVSKAILPFVILVLAILAVLPLPWNRPLEDAFSDVLFKVRGQRALSERIFFVYIGAEDIAALGGWPITRNYYAYLTHVLNGLGAEVIGLYFIFDSKDPRYPEYDRIFAEFAKKAENVCLPMAFYQLAAHEPSQSLPDSLPSRLYAGIHPILPMPELTGTTSAIGFSNLGDEIVSRRAPLLALDRDTVRFSFAAELARLYFDSKEIAITPSALVFDAGTKIAVNRHGQIRVNHFGDSEQVQAIGLLDLLQIHDSKPDSLDLSGKIVLLDITAPGIPKLQATPLAPAVPASLVHGNIAENIIEGNFLKELPSIWHGIVVLFLAWGAWLLARKRSIAFNLVMIPIVLLCYLLLAQLSFNYLNVLLPGFYPVLACGSTFAYAIFKRHGFAVTQDIAGLAMLKQEISSKEAQLTNAQRKLTEMQTHSRLAQAQREQILELEKQLGDLQSYVAPPPESTPVAFSEIICAESSKMANVLNLVEKVASDNIPVLILGETGTGKELIANAIHRSSDRRQQPFVTINCGALPETLLESELFGHERGSFTGAAARRRGRFELADGGTIFLDEITETSAQCQARLLRVLQEGQFARVGAEQTLTVDVRIIAATNRDVAQEVDDGRFRADLYYRLNGFPITIPSLQDRPVDIPLLVDHFLKKHDYIAIKGVSDRARQAMLDYYWPGNVRELENATRRAAILVQSERRELIQINDLPETMQEYASQQHGIEYFSLETQILESLRALQFSHSAINKTAEALGNRDRGTITEYFRGLCFQSLVKHAFSLDKTARMISASDDLDIIARVSSKIESYIKNLYPLPDSANLAGPSANRSPSQFQGLPKRYHEDLNKLIEFLHESGTLRP
jgi:transcriptional regulator with GAF, ATPase, and Fis domain